MRKTIKRGGAFICAIIMAFSLNINAFAANKYYDRGYSHSGNVYTHTVKFTKWGTDKVTIVNTGSRQIYVQCVGASNATFSYINPGCEKTFAYYGNGPYKVKVQPLYRGTHTYRIKTTSGTIN